MFGAIGDSAPDRWGRALMRRMERQRADREKQAPRTLFEIDYLLLVDDQTRAGALRFRADERGPFLRESDPRREPPNYCPQQSALSTRTRRTRTSGVLRRYGAAPKRDMEALWRRIVFNILISNTDDHLRNHGLL
jgi:hypothetical protein